MTAEQFLIKKLNPKSGTLKTGVMNNDYAAELMEEYITLHTGKLKEPVEYEKGYTDGWNNAIKKNIRILEFQKII